MQCQINVPLIRDLLAELRPKKPARAKSRTGATAKAPGALRPAGRTGPVPNPVAGLVTGLRARTRMLPRRWPETLAASAVLLLTGLLASGLVNPMLPWLS